MFSGALFFHPCRVEPSTNAEKTPHMLLPSPSPRFLLGACGSPKGVGTSTHKGKAEEVTRLLPLGLGSNKAQLSPALYFYHLNGLVRPGRRPQSSEATCLSQRKPGELGMSTSPGVRWGDSGKPGRKKSGAGRAIGAHGRRGGTLGTELGSHPITPAIW